MPTGPLLRALRTATASSPNNSVTLISKAAAIGAKNTEEVIITESVIDAAALCSAGLRNVIPVYGMTGLTEEIMAHLVECRVKRVVLLLDADDAGRAAAIDMAQRLAAMNIEARAVELPVKDAKFIDPSGEGLVLLGDDAEYVKAELERKTGYKLNRNEKAGVVTIDSSSKRQTGGEVSDSLAAKLEGVINLQDDQKNTVTVTINTTRDEKGEIFVDDFKTRSLDVSDYKTLNQADAKLGSTLLGHVLDEYQQAATTFRGLTEKEQFDKSHANAIAFESKVLSDYTKVSEKPRHEINIRGISTVGFQYTSIQYDIQRKSDSGPGAQVIQNVRITQRRRP